ncbi:NAD(P)/FAD-dependent oxidoreductase [Nocardioides sp. B-3]|uniref:NAD(P)/FAD-dependent oxidoreductase n=1 Tax=Nocardioides sp. B-3 TaxID=2895565 RepID=UPI0021526F08|nr:FAD-dependent oxidoreductase [Nocardioides sp. B-3]UUZ60123.1 FAD-dependent oxidoreductase [Nocardioides sp. B-3]
MTAPIVIIGGGMAAGHAAVELRENGYDGELVVFADEPHPPYERPPLSKGYLAGKASLEDTYLKPLEWYGEHRIDVRPGTRVDSIDTDAHLVRTAEGSQPFSKLLIATGAQPRRLPVPGTDHIEVAYLRSIDDSRRLHERLTPGARLLVVGGGWIGMEVASTARELGAEVVLVEPTEQPLLKVLGPELGERLADVHRKHGVDLRTRTSLETLRDRVAVLSDGTEAEVDTVVIGVGAAPDDALAGEAGLDADNGILVDAGLRTSHPDVFAAGDVANHAHPLLGERVRVEHWQSAVSRGKFAAHALMGEPGAYDELPFFFSDQYDLGLEYFGHPGAAGYDAVKIDEGSGDSLVARWYRGDLLVAAMHVNDWDVSDELKEQVRAAR